VRAFTRLYLELDATTRTSEKVEALRAHFSSVAPADAAWAVHVLTGGRVKRAVNARLLRNWAAAESGIPLWLVEESYAAVGDLAETLSLLLPEGQPGTDLPLAQVMEEWILPLPPLPEAEKRRRVVAAWRELDRPQRFVWHKLIGGGFRVGVARTLVIRALAETAGVSAAVMAHRLSGGWEPSAAAYRALMREGEEGGGPGRPYPFFLAHPLEGDPGLLGPRGEWQVEWKWDGIRAQLLRRSGVTLLWSRGEESVTASFPELEAAAAALPDGVVMDGEIVAWKGERPLSFRHLQRRLNRRTVGPRLRREVPVRYLAYDLLEWGGVDWRSRPLRERRAGLEELVAGLGGPSGPSPAESGVLTLDLPLGEPPEASLQPHPIALSPLVEGGDWGALATSREGARERGVEGLMLKRLDAPYRAGRPRGDWWKWKVEPLTVDAVLLYAQRGRGRRAGLYTDYTFGVWEGDELVPVAKAYSGLTDREIRRVDRWIRAHTSGRFGPVRVVEPGLVFELAFEGIQPSSRHRAGVALRFPRMARWREDKAPSEADTLDTLRALPGVRAP
jgi:DNA ligase 1